MSVDIQNIPQSTRVNFNQRTSTFKITKELKIAIRMFSAVVNTSTISIWFLANKIIDLFVNLAILY